jgi:protoheme IX farnesyltransferase
MLVVLTAAAGFCLAARGGIDYPALANLTIGVLLLSSGISALNQYLEREVDGLMLRTKSRPLPSRRLSPIEALLFGLALSIAATFYLLIFVNVLTGVLGLATLVSYLFGYTPLKTRSTLSTVIGALPGAMPPLIGWTGARGQITIEPLILFAILFLWQFPHFLAIAWMYKEDYARAGIKMLPVVEPDGRVTSRQIVSYTMMLLPASLLPVLANLAGQTYLAGALVLGVLFLYFSVRASIFRTKWEARRLLMASVIYLPALFGLMVVGR